MKFYKDRIIIDPAPLAVSFRNALVSISKDNSDVEFIRFVKNMDIEWNFNNIKFLHVDQVSEIINSFSNEMDSDLSYKENRLERIKKEIESKIEFVYKTNQLDKKFKVLVNEGQACLTISKQADDQNIDLVLLKRKTEIDKELIKLIKTVRVSNTNCLVYPAGAKYQIKHLIVPVDLSINSARALKAAIKIMGLMKGNCTITCVCVIDLTASSASYSESKEKNIENMEVALNEFIGRATKQMSSFVINKLVIKDYRSVAEILYDQVQKLAGDFVVIGSQGHSDVHFKLLGSTTEKFIACNSSFPTLIVK